MGKICLKLIEEATKKKNETMEELRICKRLIEKYEKIINSNGLSPELVDKIIENPSTTEKLPETKEKDK